MAKSKAPRKQMKPVTRLINPAEYARTKHALESHLTEKEADRYALTGWIYLDDVLSGSGCEASSKGLTRMLVMLQILAADQQNRPMYDLTVKAIEYWQRALELSYSRGASPALSTSAKQAIKRCMSQWDAALKKINVGTISMVTSRWHQIETKFCIYSREEAA